MNLFKWLDVVQENDNWLRNEANKAIDEGDDGRAIALSQTRLKCLGILREGG